MYKIIYCFPSLDNSGGMERILTIKANYFAENLGHEVIIVTSERYGDKSFFPLSKKIKIYNLNINYNKYNNKLIRIILRPVLKLIHKKKLSNLLYKLKPDFTISFFQHESSFLTKIKDGSTKILENHFCYEFRNQIYNKKFYKILNLLRNRYDAKIAERYDAFVCLTEEDKQDWPNKKNITVIPNPITIQKNQNKNIVKEESKNILTVGRFCYQKGFDNLIYAWAKVESVNPDWHLTIIGNQNDSKYVNYIKSIITNLNLRNIILKKATDNILQEYLNADFLVMSSNYEGLPLTLLEAQYIGLPLVSFDCKCGPKDIIKNGYNGFLIKKCDINNLSEKISLLIKDRNLRAEFSKNALSESSKYLIDNILFKWNILFDKLKK